MFPDRVLDRALHRSVSDGGAARLESSTDPSVAELSKRWHSGHSIPCQVLGSLRPQLRDHRRGRRIARVDRERDLYQVLFTSPRWVPPAKDLGTILTTAVALDHLVDRKLLRIHPLEVDPPLRPRVVAAPYRDHSGVRPQVRDHNLGDVPSLNRNLLNERSHVR